MIKPKSIKTNRLLINMKNKVSILDGAIEQCKKLKNNETIELNGLFPMKVTRGQHSDKWFDDRISELKKRNPICLKEFGEWVGKRIKS
jgi:hypothetical protein